METISCLLTSSSTTIGQLYALRRDLGKGDVDKPLLAHVVYVEPGLLHHHKESPVLVEGKECYIRSIFRWVCDHKYRGRSFRGTETTGVSEMASLLYIITSSPIQSWPAVARRD